MTKTRKLSIASIITLATLTVQTPAIAAPKDEARQHVDMAHATLNKFVRDPEMAWMKANMGNAKALLIVPKVVKAGFVFGGSGGRGVLLVRAEPGKWNGPAFYTVGTASVGFQAGVQVSEVVMMIMTEKAVNKLLSTSTKIGADASVAAGPRGAGTESTIREDIVAFTRSKGLYGGLNLDGSVVKPADDWNSAYYGKPVLPPQILLKGEVHNAQADKLLETATNSSSTKATQ